MGGGAFGDSSLGMGRIGGARGVGALRTPWRRGIWALRRFVGSVGLVSVRLEEFGQRREFDTFRRALAGARRFVDTGNELLVRNLIVVLVAAISPNASFLLNVSICGGISATVSISKIFSIGFPVGWG